jgi:hypothetical protein
VNGGANGPGRYRRFAAATYVGLETPAHLEAAFRRVLLADPRITRGHCNASAFSDNLRHSEAHGGRNVKRRDASAQCAVGLLVDGRTDGQVGSELLVGSSVRFRFLRYLNVAVFSDYLLAFVL